MNFDSEEPILRRLHHQWCVSRDAALFDHKLTGLTHPTIEL